MTSPSLFLLEEGMIFNLFLSPMDRVMHPHPPCSAADSWTRDSGNIAIIELIVHKKYEGTHILLDAHGKKTKKAETKHDVDHTALVIKILQS